MKLDFNTLTYVGDSARQRLQSVRGVAGFAAVPENLPELIKSIITGFLAIIGVIFFVLAFYGGFIWMKARGNEKEVERAKDILTNAMIGIVLVFAAYAISTFVITLVTR